MNAKFNLNKYATEYCKNIRLSNAAVHPDTSDEKRKEFRDKAAASNAALREMINNLPHGSGIDADCEVTVVWNGTICIKCSYHIMNNGMYSRWIDYRVLATPKFCEKGFDFKIVGNFYPYMDVKDYLYDVYNEALEI